MSARLEKGEEVPVVYMADDPDVMVLYTRGYMIKAALANLIPFIVGIVFLASGIGLLIATLFFGLSSYSE